MSAWRCPSCDAANAPRAVVCEGCGYERAAPRSAPSAVVSPTQRLVNDYHAPLDEERARIADAAGAVLARLRERFSVPLAAPTLVLAETTTPTCAGCAVPADPAILRDARLWHERCWDRHRDRVARARWMR